MNLKRFLLFLVVPLLMFVAKTSQAAENQAATKYWYSLALSIQESAHAVNYTGSSNLAENEFIALTNGQTPIFLNNVLSINQMGKIVSISETTPYCTNNVYINPKYIVSVTPLKGDPREELARLDQ